MGELQRGHLHQLKTYVQGLGKNIVDLCVGKVKAVNFMVIENEGTGNDRAEIICTNVAKCL